MTAETTTKPLKVKSSTLLDILTNLETLEKKLEDALKEMKN